MSAIMLLTASLGCGDGSSELPTMAIYQLPAGAEWSVATPAPAPNEAVAQTYDLSDLIDQVAAELNDNRAEALETIRHTVTALGEQPSVEWSDADSGQLVVTASEADHSRIVELVDVWRVHGLQQWVVEIRAITLPRSTALPLGPGGRIVSSGSHGPADEPSLPPVLGEDGTATGTASVVTCRGVPLYLATVGEGTALQILQLAQGDERSSVMFAPKVTVFTGQHATVVNGVERPFVTGLQSLGWSQPNPHVDVVAEGQVIDVRVMPGDDPGSAHLECRIDLTHVSEVVTTGIPGDGDSEQPTVVQVPSVERVRLVAAANLAVNEMLLLMPLEPSSVDHATCFLVAVRAVDE